MTKNSDSKCRALTKAGKRCRAPATDGGLCFFHANPNKPSELGRIGGRHKGYSAPKIDDPPPLLDSSVAVRDFVARLIADVYAGKVPPRIGAGLAPLLNLQMRMVEGTEVARMKKQVAMMERQLLELRLKDEASPKGKASDIQTSGP